MSDALPVPTPGTTSAAPAAASAAAPPAGVPVAVKSWNEVNQPGSYVCNDTGRLIRVPASALKDGKTPVIELLGPQGPSKVTRLSDNPGLPIADLRVLSTGAHVKPQF